MTDSRIDEKTHNHKVLLERLRHSPDDRWAMREAVAFLLEALPLESAKPAQAVGDEETVRSALRKATCEHWAEGYLLLSVDQAYMAVRPYLRTAPVDAAGGDVEVFQLALPSIKQAYGNEGLLTKRYEAALRAAKPVEPEMHEPYEVKTVLLSQQNTGDEPVSGDGSISNDDPAAFSVFCGHTTSPEFMCSKCGSGECTCAELNAKSQRSETTATARELFEKWCVGRPALLTHSAKEDAFYIWEAALSARIESSAESEK